MQRIKEIVLNEHRPVSLLDFLPSFEIEGKKYDMKYSSLRNILSSLRRTHQIQVAFKTKQTFYTLPGITFGSKMMTPYHTGVPSSSSADNDSLYRRIQDLPIGKNALHDIHLGFNKEDIWSLLSATGSFKINSFSKDIRLPVWEIRSLNIKTTIHHSDTVSVVVGGSYHPIAVDFNGIVRLSNALTSVEERLYNLIQESSMSSTAPSKQDDGRLLVPDHMGWIVTMWHFGVDGLTEYTGEKFSCTWEVGQNALIRAYTKDFGSGRTHIRLERQEYPRKSLAYAIEEKLNSTSNSPIVR